MDQENKVEVLYPDLASKYSPEEREYLATLQKNSKQDFPIQSNNPQIIPQFQQPLVMDKFPQILNFHTIRSHQSWNGIVKETIDWVNKNIHAVRIVSFSVLLCHSTRAGQITVFYDQGKNPAMEAKIKNHISYGLSAMIVDTCKTWENHHGEVMKNMQELVGNERVVLGVSELEVNMDHKRAMSVIWFLYMY